MSKFNRDRCNSFGHVFMALFVMLLVILNMNQIIKLEDTVSTARLKATRALQGEEAMVKETMDSADEAAKSITAGTGSASSPSGFLTLPIVKRPERLPKNLVKAGDYTYYSYSSPPRWDASPIVVEKYKLVFFTIPKVGCTVWKQLFRRMMGYEDWKVQDEATYLPHNPETNGLKYLSQYTLEEANKIMTSPEWTRAIMLRDPKQRLLSAFLDKSVSNDHRHIIDRCCPDGSCVEKAQNIPGFMKLIQRCDDEHWRSQNKRMESKYWPYIDFVGHVETAAEDAKQLLEHVGAWEEYGASGWGKNGTLPIFGSTGVGGAGGHATWSQYKHWQWYTPDSEKMVESFYREDYLNPLFNFAPNTCLTCVEDEKKDN